MVIFFWNRLHTPFYCNVTISKKILSSIEIHINGCNCSNVLGRSFDILLFPTVHICWTIDCSHITIFCPGRRRQCQFHFRFIAVKLEISIELNLIRSDDFQTEFKVATAEAKHSFDLLIKYSFTAHNKKFALNSIHKKMPWNNSKTRSMRMYLLNSMIKQEKNLKYWG